MQIIRQNEHAPGVRPSVVLGYFDGLHCAHLELFRLAAQSGAQIAALTFSGEKSPFITSESEKLALLEKAGVDIVYLYDFNDVKGIAYDAFFRDEIVSRIGASSLFCGFNYTFGKDARGGAAELTALADAAGIKTTVAPEIQIDGVCVSSTNIRDLLAAGDINKAALFLGRSFSITGKVIHGQGLGRKLGFPTINIKYGDGRAPIPRGVYFTTCVIGGGAHPAVTSVGTRPTVEGHTLLCESYLLDINQNLYGEEVEVAFLDFKRSEKKFENISELTSAVEADISAAKEYFDIKI